MPHSNLIDDVIIWYIIPLIIVLFAGLFDAKEYPPIEDLAMWGVVSVIPVLNLCVALFVVIAFVKGSYRRRK